MIFWHKLTVIRSDTAFTALGYAIRNGELRTVREILEGDEFNHQLLKRADYVGNTPVHLAAVGPNPDILRELLTRGASVHPRNHANHTPLYLAEKMGNVETMKLLREAGAHLWRTEPHSGNASEAGDLASTTDVASLGATEDEEEEGGVTELKFNGQEQKASDQVTDRVSPQHGLDKGSLVTDESLVHGLKKGDIGKFVN